MLIVDDHPLSRRAIAAILEQDSAFEIAGEAADGLEAIDKTRSLMPDLILMDIRMPRLDGLEATQRIKAEFPYTTIVILSVSNDQRDFFEAIKSGAQGYLLKDMQPETWLDYLHALAAGNTPISREMANAILREFIDGPPGPPAGAPQEAAARSAPGGGPGLGVIGLSKREQEILKAVARGLNNREIGESLHISENTVKNHLKNILAKLHLRNRAQLVAYAYDRGWLKPDAGSPESGALEP